MTLTVDWAVKSKHRQTQPSCTFCMIWTVCECQDEQYSEPLKWIHLQNLCHTVSLYHLCPAKLSPPPSAPPPPARYTQYTVHASAVGTHGRRRYFMTKSLRKIHVCGRTEDRTHYLRNICTSRTLHLTDLADRAHWKRCVLHVFYHGCIHYTRLNVAYYGLVACSDIPVIKQVKWQNGFGYFATFYSKRIVNRN